MSAPLPVYSFDLPRFTSDLIKRLLRSIAGTADDATLKACIMTAWGHGHITQEEASILINAWGVREA